MHQSEWEARQQARCQRDFLAAAVVLHQVRQENNKKYNYEYYNSSTTVLYEYRKKGYPASSDVVLNSNCLFSFFNKGVRDAICSYHALIPVHVGR